MIDAEYAPQLLRVEAPPTSTTTQELVVQPRPRTLAAVNTETVHSSTTTTTATTTTVPVTSPPATLPPAQPVQVAQVQPPRTTPTVPAPPPQTPAPTTVAQAHETTKADTGDSQQGHNDEGHSHKGKSDKGKSDKGHGGNNNSNHSSGGTTTNAPLYGDGVESSGTGAADCASDPEKYQPLPITLTLRDQLSELALDAPREESRDPVVRLEVTRGCQQSREVVWPDWSWSHLGLGPATSSRRPFRESGDLLGTVTDGRSPEDLPSPYSGLMSASPYNRSS